MKQLIDLIATDRIKDPERPVRTNLTPESVDDLVFSIKEVGIIQPLTVCKSGEGYEIIAGHRRLLAAEICKLVEVPCIVVDIKDFDKEILKMHENIGRADINPIDWANHIGYLKQQYNLSSAKLAEKIGFSESWVSEHLEILNYPPEVLQAIREGTLAFSAARELAKIKNPIKRQVYVRAAVKGGVTPTMAVRWKIEANREPLKQHESEETEITDTTQYTSELPQPECPVCGELIPFNEIVSLQIHFKCQPPPPTADK